MTTDSAVHVVMGLMLTALEFVAVVLLVATLVLVVRRRRRRRDARLARQWEQAVDRGRATGARLAYVRNVYQRARTGSKAIIVWHAGGGRQDTWFPGWWAQEQSYVLVVGRWGWGPHNANPDTYFVARDGVLAVLPADAPRAWERDHRRRLRRDRTAPAGR